MDCLVKDTIDHI